MCLLEDLLVADRLREFLPFWEITSDQWVLNILREGYSIELLHVPPFAGICSIRPSPLGADVLSKEVNVFLHKRAAVPVPLDQERAGYFALIL